VRTTSPYIFVFDAAMYAHKVVSLLKKYAIAHL
jgi:hypothetical protein